MKRELWSSEWLAHRKRCCGFESCMGNGVNVVWKYTCLLNFFNLGVASVDKSVCESISHSGVATPRDPRLDRRQAKSTAEGAAC